MEWTDNLPISKTEPFTFTTSDPFYAAQLDDEGTLVKTLTRLGRLSVKMGWIDDPTQDPEPAGESAPAKEPSLMDKLKAFLKGGRKEEAPKQMSPMFSSGTDSPAFSAAFLSTAPPPWSLKLAHIIPSSCRALGRGRGPSSCLGASRVIYQVSLDTSLMEDARNDTILALIRCAQAEGVVPAYLVVDGPEEKPHRGGPGQGPEEFGRGHLEPALWGTVPMLLPLAVAAVAVLEGAYSGTGFGLAVHGVAGLAGGVGKDALHLAHHQSGGEDLPPAGGKHQELNGLRVRVGELEEQVREGEEASRENERTGPGWPRAPLPPSRPGGR